MWHEVDGRGSAAADVAHARQHGRDDGTLTLALRSVVGEAGGDEGAREVLRLARPRRAAVAAAPKPRTAS